MKLFDINSFDLDGYLARIGATHIGRGLPSGRPSADLQTLNQLALLHPCAIPFENLNPLTRRPLRLDIASIQDKLVRGGRGGWCFEHNLLLGTALTALGFEVVGLSARVVWNVPAGVVRGRSHMVLHVRLDGHSYIVDVGFGGSTPTGPLLLQADTVQQTPHEPFRLTATDDAFLLEAQLEGIWRGLYVFDLQPQALADYEMPNWYLCNHPDSHFLIAVVAAPGERDRRYALRNNELAVHYPDRPSERRTLGSAGDVRQTLTDVFHINVPDWADLDETLERLIQPAPVPQPT